MFKKTIIILLLLMTNLFAVTLSLQEGKGQYFDAKSSIAKFMNSSKQILSVRQLDKDTLKLTGLKRGKAYIYLWDMDNHLSVLKVNVFYNKEMHQDEAIAQNDSSGSVEVYFKFDPENQTPVNKRMLNEKVYYKTEINDYKVDLFLENKNVGSGNDSNVEQLGKFKLSVAKGSTLLAVGDNDIRYTPLAAQSLSIQGLRARFLAWDTVFDIFGGKKSGEYWGSAVEDHAVRDNSSNHLSGLRVSKRIVNNIKVGYTYLKQDSFDSGDSRILDNSISAVDTSFRLSDYFFRLDVALSNTDGNGAKGAQQVKVDFNKPKYGFDVCFRDINPAYVPIADYFNYLGAQGLFFYGRYKPDRNFVLSGYYENYLKRFDEEYYGINNDDYTLDRGRLNLTIKNLGFVRPRISTFRNIRISPESGINNVFSGYSLYLDQIELLPKSKLILYFQFSPYKYSDNLDEVLSYSGSMTKSGLRSRLNSWLNVRFEHQSDVYYYEYSDSKDLHGYNFIASFGKFKIIKKIDFELSYWFQNFKDSMNTIDKNMSSIRVALSQSVTPDLYWYLRAVLSQENSLRYEWEDRVGYFYDQDTTRSEISGGCTYKF